MQPPPTPPAGETQRDAAVDGDDGTIGPPRLSLVRLFWRFLRFGLLAWGGPVAQIGLLRAELVDDERWVAPARFNRVLSVYQVLPGPEATELCIYFGQLARGRIGGLVAGLAFMLPGFALMLAIAAAYVQWGVQGAVVAGVLVGMQAGASALVVRATSRIARHALTGRLLWVLAGFGAALTLAGVHFALVLVATGTLYTLARRGRAREALLMAVLIAAAGVAALVHDGGSELLVVQQATGSAATSGGKPASPGELLWSGFQAGSLTFGGAYTSIPFVQHDAVVQGGWASPQQFLDGLALGSVLPAPLIIFTTFVGYLAGGLDGAAAITFGIFLPAFAITLLGHGRLERLVDDVRVHYLLDGITAGVVGLIGVTAAGLVLTAVRGGPVAVPVIVVAVVVLERWQSRWALLAVMVASGIAGLVVGLPA